MSQSQDWYSNKELFELFSNMTKEMATLKNDLNQTMTLIRDYNGLREDIKDVNKRVTVVETTIQTSSSNKRDYMGWIIAIIMAIFNFITLITTLGGKV